MVANFTLFMFPGQAQTMNDDKEAKLHIPRAERGDTGKYTIKVANEHGEESADIAVVVLGMALGRSLLNNLLLSYIREINLKCTNISWSLPIAFTLL